ncbi:tetratricopeptide repeat protein [Calothrix sp. NIES-3974]|uniref:tetratricopeptide repeat protein n=1 Tax=Calothrix sp. NIES-3974 TaxID=2005462 RepID=UPI000B611D13|nr:tetratricopeptide repeat protein [Calothrix sp. NIES-3974]BAZ08164.1 TPR repeat-containing protein [Calothrix sp. NIES-3974]
MYKRNILVCAFLFTSIFTGFAGSAGASLVVAQAQGNDQEFRQLLEQGRQLVDRGDYESAMRIYQNAAQMRPRNGSVHSGIGILYVKQNNYSAALSAFQRAIALEPNNADYHHALGYLHGNLGNLPAARESYRRAIRLNRNHVDAYLGLASVLTHLGDRQGAAWSYQQAEKIAPRNPRVAEYRSFIMNH